MASAVVMLNPLTFDTDRAYRAKATSFSPLRTTFSQCFSNPVTSTQAHWLYRNVYVSNLNSFASNGSFLPFVTISSICLFSSRRASFS